MGMYSDWVERNPDTNDKSMVNVEWVLKKLDECVDNVSHIVPIKIPNGANLNDYTTPGYYVREESTLPIVNVPANSSSFFLEVLKSNNRLVEICSIIV